MIGSTNLKSNALTRLSCSRLAFAFWNQSIEDTAFQKPNVSNDPPPSAEIIMKGKKKVRMQIASAAPDFLLHLNPHG